MRKPAKEVLVLISKQRKEIWFDEECQWVIDNRTEMHRGQERERYEEHTAKRSIADKI